MRTIMETNTVPGTKEGASASAETRREAERQFAILRRGAVDIIPADELLQKIARSVETGRPLRVKLGLDPSAPDVHVGHAVVLDKLRQFQDLGHMVQIVIGDFTGRIGDPTGKSETRRQLTADEVKQNAETYRTQIFKVLDPGKTEVTFNSTWLAPLTFADVVRLASTLTVARMLERDDFRKRFGEGVPISIHEFFYPLMQGYDSVALQSDVELGGTDQTFNLLMGRTLQKEFGLEPQIALTMPLIEGLDGVQKMSKSLGNYIGVNESAKEIYGKAMSIPDTLMVKYFDLLTGYPETEVKGIADGLAQGSLHPRDAKMRLAHRLTERFAGLEAADAAQAEFVQVFQKREFPDEIEEFGVPSTSLALVALLVQAGLAPSHSEARRLIAGGGVRVDGEKIGDASFEFVPKSGMIVQVGKRQFRRLRVE